MVEKIYQFYQYLPQQVNDELVFDKQLHPMFTLFLLERTSWVNTGRNNFLFFIFICFVFSPFLPSTFPQKISFSHFDMPHVLSTVGKCGQGAVRDCSIKKYSLVMWYVNNWDWSIEKRYTPRREIEEGARCSFKRCWQRCRLPRDDSCCLSRAI